MNILRTTLLSFQLGRLQPCCTMYLYVDSIAHEKHFVLCKRAGFDYINYYTLAPTSILLCSKMQF